MVYKTFVIFISNKYYSKVGAKSRVCEGWEPLAWLGDRTLQPGSSQSTVSPACQVIARTDALPASL